MNAFITSFGLIALALLLIAAAPDEKTKGGAGQGGQVEPAVVPSYLFNVWLCRPGAESVTVSVIAWEPIDACITFGDGLKTDALKLETGVPQSLVMSGLKPDTSYNYQLTYRPAGAEATQDVVRSFHTQRKAASSFSFVMQADSHLDNNTDFRVYQQTLANNGQITQGFQGGFVDNGSADRHPDEGILTSSTRLVGTTTGFAALGAIPGLKAKVHQRVELIVGDQQDIAAFTAVPAVRATLGDVLFASE